jgi:hypothetical protein
MNMKKSIVVLLMILASTFAKAQVSVANISLMPYNITPESLLSATILNQGTEQQVYLVSKLYNLNNDLLIVVRSSPFIAKQGLTSGFGGNRKAAAIEYTAGNLVNYIKTSHALPSGAFKICVQVITISGGEPSEFCDDIQSDLNQYLYLVSPGDKEVIPTTSPVLSWWHSEPFNVLSTGEFFRMIVAEIKDNQSPQEAISMNSPVMMKDYVNVHNLQYPYEAKPLEKGKRYAWQVAKLGNGTVLNITETWEFKIEGVDPKTNASYTSLRKELDGGFYTPQNNKLFFKFEEEYTGGIVSCIIFNEQRQSLHAKAINQGEKKDQPNYKSRGVNEYEIDLDDYAIPKGFYTLEVKNSKNELFLLKFYVE